MTHTTPETSDLYAVPLRVGAFSRPCGCNQGTENGESCVLIATVPGVAGAVVLRDSKRPEAGELRFTGAEWTEFLKTQTGPGDVINRPTAVAPLPRSGVPRSDRWWCYTWSGAVVPDWQRRDPGSMSPPLLVREWVGKPRSMLARTCTDPADAVGWLRGEVRGHAAAQIQPPDPGRLGRLLGYLDHQDDPEPGSQHRCRYGPCDVQCFIGRHNRIVHWQYGLGGGHAVVWAIVPDRAVDIVGVGEAARAAAATPT